MGLTILGSLLMCQQDLRPLQWVLQWRGLLSPFHLHSLLEGEFFPKWMHVLYAWLAAPGADFSEVRALLAHVAGT
jgi:tuftelin-interacting protein 11